MSYTEPVLTESEVTLVTQVSRFWAQVDRLDDDECWPWRGYQEDGYGRFFFGRKMRGAHELALTFTTGERRAKGLDTCHSCNNPICCNPRHLRFGSRASNVQDAVVAGTALGNGKLTEDDVRTIRQRLSMGARQVDLAEDFGITNSMVSMIKTGKRFAYVR